MMCLCLFTFLICFTLACPQSYNRRPPPFNRDYDYPSNDWEFAAQRNGYQNRLGDPFGLNGNNNPRGMPGRQIELRHMLEDRSYDLAYGLGTGYGQKLGTGIKNGVQESTMKKFLSGLGLKPSDVEKEDKGGEEEEEKKKKKEEP